MSEQDTSPAARLQSGALRPAQVIRTVCQLLLGAGLAIALILKVYMAVLTDHVCVAGEAGIGNLIRCTPTLLVMAYILALSAGIDLAQRLFEDDAKRILSPLVLGVAAATLGVLNGVLTTQAGWREALVIVSLVASIGAILYLREVLASGRER